MVNKTIKIWKSLDGDVAQHCFVTKKYNISPTVAYTIWIYEEPDD